MTSTLFAVSEKSMGSPSSSSPTQRGRPARQGEGVNSVQSEKRVTGTGSPAAFIDSTSMVSI